MAVVGVGGSALLVGRIIILGASPKDQNFESCFGKIGFTNSSLLDFSKHPKGHPIADWGGGLPEDKFLNGHTHSNVWSNILF